MLWLKITEVLPGGETALAERVIPPEAIKATWERATADALRRICRRMLDPNQFPIDQPGMVILSLERHPTSASYSPTELPGKRSP